MKGEKLEAMAPGENTRGPEGVESWFRMVRMREEVRLDVGTPNGIASAFAS